MASGSLDPAAAQRRVGLRVIASQSAVLHTALVASAPPSRVDAVVSAVREHLGDGSTRTGCNVLRTFTDVGLMHRIEPAARPGLHELRGGDNHHDIVCRRRDASADVDFAVGNTPSLTAADDAVDEIDEAEAISWGRCPASVVATSGSSGDSKRPRSARHQLGDSAWDSGQPRSGANSHSQETLNEEEDRHV